MISHPTTPPIAQIITVSRLMGMSSARTRFVRKRRTTPTIPLTMSCPRERPPRVSTSNTIITTSMSTTSSINQHSIPGTAVFHTTVLVAQDLPLVVEDKLGETLTVQEPLCTEQYLLFVAAILTFPHGFLHTPSTYRRMRRLATARANPRTRRLFRPLIMRPRVRELLSTQITIFAFLMTVASPSV
jgi:hypothetical protein